MSEKLGGSHEHNPEIGDFNKAPESGLSQPQPPTSDVSESEQSTVNAYGLKPEDVQQLQRFFEALAKDDLLLPAIRVGLFDKEQRPQILQYPDIFSEPVRRKPSLLRSLGQSFAVVFKVTAIESVLLGERSKAKPHYTFDLGRLVENGMELHILCTILRQSKKQKILDVLPDEKLTSYLYRKAGQHFIWGTPFDELAPASSPGRDAYDEIEEL